jgi:hypothetical protein
MSVIQLLIVAVLGLALVCILAVFVYLLLSPTPIFP